MKTKEDLIQLAKKLYPSNPFELFELLEQGNEFVGRILDDSSQMDIRVDDILNAETLEALKERASIIKQKRELYIDWLEIYRPQNKWR